MTSPPLTSPLSPSHSDPCWTPLATSTNGNGIDLLDLAAIASNISNNTATELEANFRSNVITGLAIFRLILAVCGLVSNIVAAIVLTNRKLWSPTSILLLSLVVYDAIFLLVLIPVIACSISVNVNYTPDRQNTFFVVMAVVFPLRNMAQMASTYTTLTVTLERYLVILLPLRASSMWTYGKTRRAIVGVLIFSVLFNLPRCFDHLLTQPGPSSGSLFSSPGKAEGLGAALNSSGLYPPAEAALGLTSSGSTICPWPQRMLEDKTNQSGGEANPGRKLRHHQRNNNDISKRPFNFQGHRATTKTFHNNFTEVSFGGRIAGEGTVGATNAAGGKGKTGSSSGQALDSAKGHSSSGLIYFYRVVYLFYFTVVVLYLIPYTLIPILNFQLVLALRRRREETRKISVKKEHRLNGAGGASSPMDKEEGLTYIVFGITLCFFVCCILPAVHLVTTMALATNVPNDFRAAILLNAGETTLVINAATDFFFYCLLGRKFRRVFLRTFCPRRYLRKSETITLRTTVSYNSV